MNPSSSLQILSDVIRRRRAIFPPVYTDDAIPKEWIAKLLENARWAPTHRRTEPWRFHVFRQSARAGLAHAMASAYQTHTAPESFSEGKRQKVLNHILRSDTVIVIVMHRDAQERVPEWEEVAAVAAAVQNMWLTATAMGLGAYWSTPAHMCQLDTFLKLSPGQRCLGLFYIGHYDMPQMEGSRQTLDEKVVWYTD